ncbi:hypothetical protein SAMN04487983_10104 [Streptomyces sp. yr375]|uniref:hypothetical protein n=1 Tax=Streptomyces sp. yr375 TaxID=1761906 RepID=UPI0008CC7D44|nr:hypothetical protein [Streptomyces sp. yr375]SEQ97424.1 hypothetical protein SAMN04487983_10104 [Streptomyces sp. yr375]
MTENTSRSHFRVRRAAAVGTALLSAAASVLLAQPAQAAGPNGAVNIRGQESWNTDEMMSRVCGTRGDTRYQDWYVNVTTGELRDHSSWRKGPVWHKDHRKWTLQPGWERFEGHCEYPVASSWTYRDAWRPISETRTNCTDSGYSLELSREYSTSKSYSHTVGGSTTVEADINSWFGVSAEASYSYSWAIENSVSVANNDVIEIGAQKTAWIEASPMKRVVRVNPVFKVDSYTWNPTGKRGDVVDVTTWRDRGYDRIYSYGNYIDGTADELKSDGKPMMTFRKKDRPAGTECN